MNNESLITSNPIFGKKPSLWKALLRVSSMTSSAIEGIRPSAKDLRRVRAKFAFLKKRRVKGTSA